MVTKLAPLFSKENQMDLKDAKLGEQYRVFIDDSGALSETPNMKTMIATVIAVNKPGVGSSVIIGWKSTEDRPRNAVPRYNPSLNNDYIPDANKYTFGLSVPTTLLVAIRIVNGLDGFSCIKCSNFYPYALPNQANGTLICWSCRNRR